MCAKILRSTPSSHAYHSHGSVLQVYFFHLLTKIWCDYSTPSIKIQSRPLHNSVVLRPSWVTNRLQIIFLLEEIILRNNYLRVTTGTV